MADTSSSLAPCPWHPHLCTRSGERCLTPPSWSHPPSILPLILKHISSPYLIMYMLVIHHPQPFIFGCSSSHREKNYQVMSQHPRLYPEIPLASHQLSNPPSPNNISPLITQNSAMLLWPLLLTLLLPLLLTFLPSLLLLCCCYAVVVTTDVATAIDSVISTYVSTDITHVIDIAVATIIATNIVTDIAT